MCIDFKSQANNFTNNRGQTSLFYYITGTTVRRPAWHLTCSILFYKVLTNDFVASVSPCSPEQLCSSCKHWQSNIFNNIFVGKNVFLSLRYHVGRHPIAQVCDELGNPLKIISKLGMRLKNQLIQQI